MFPAGILWVFPYNKPYPYSLYRHFVAPFARQESCWWCVRQRGTTGVAGVAKRVGALVKPELNIKVLPMGNVQIY